MSPPKLDPYTLRFIADEHAAAAARFDAWSTEPHPWITPDLRARYRDRAVEERAATKRLRALATRNERRAARGAR
jgi:hypothetical protein